MLKLESDHVGTHTNDIVDSHIHFLDVLLIPHYFLLHHLIALELGATSSAKGSGQAQNIQQHIPQDQPNMAIAREVRLSETLHAAIKRKFTARIFRPRMVGSLCYTITFQQHKGTLL